ncbi:hypothetical protein CR513_06788, partial [Mucuna pruriens]
MPKGKEFAFLNNIKNQIKSKRGEITVDKQVTLVFTLGNYKDEVVYDVIPMEATHILLGRSWKYDKRVTHDRVRNRFTFEHLGHKVVLKPLSPKEVCEDQVKKSKKTKEKERKKKREKSNSIRKQKHKIPINMCLNVSYPLIELPTGFSSLLEEFKDVFPKEVPHRLPPLRGIEHHIGLTLGATLPNGTAYRTNSKESKEIQNQFDKLIEK